MKKLYNEYFNISEHGKISEKVIIMRLSITIAVVLFCLLAMGTTAFAYFSHDLTSQKYIIKSANFEANVSVQITDANGEHVPVNADNRIAPYADIKANTPYFVTLKHSERSTAKTGFVILTAERCESKYHTVQLGKDGNGNTETVTFTIISNNDTTVTFLAHWGTSSYYGYKGQDNPLYIKQGDHVEISATAPVILPPEESTAPETTVKIPEQTVTQKPETTAPPATETKKPVEVTSPETTGQPTPPATQKPIEPATEPVTPETTAPETVYTPPETTAPETTAPETTVKAPESTVPETTAPETTALETSAPEVPAEVQVEPESTATPETAEAPIANIIE